MNTLKLFFVFIALFLLQAFGTTLAAEIIIPTVKRVPSEEVNRTLINKESKFSFVYPPNWIERNNSAIPGVKAIVQAKSKQLVANCNVRAVLDNRIKEVSSDEYISITFPNDDATALLNEIRKSGLHPNLLRSGTLRVADEKAFFIEFNFVKSGTKWQTFNVQFVKNDGLYTIGCTDYASEFSKSLPELGLILTSFKVLNQ